MSRGPIDLADVVRWLDRPHATHPDTGPGNGGRPGPCNDEPTVAFKACGCLNGDLCTHPCDTTRDRIELAYAPVVHWLREAA